MNTHWCQIVPNTMKMIDLVLITRFILQRLSYANDGLHRRPCKHYRTQSTNFGSFREIISYQVIKLWSIFFSRCNIRTYFLVYIYISIELSGHPCLFGLTATASIEGWRFLEIINVTVIRWLKEAMMGPDDSKSLVEEGVGGRHGPRVPRPLRHPATAWRTNLVPLHLFHTPYPGETTWRGLTQQMSNMKDLGSGE
jgi:hypothetical protein